MFVRMYVKNSLMLGRFLILTSFNIDMKDTVLVSLELFRNKDLLKLAYASLLCK